MPSMKIRAWLISLIVILSVGGLASTSSSQEEKAKIAIFPFKDSTKRAQEVGYGDSIADMLITAFQRGGNFIIVERSQIDLIFKEQELGAAGITEQAIQLGKNLGVNMVVTGGVAQFSEGSRIELDARLIDATDGRVITALDDTAENEFSLREAVNRLARKIESEYLGIPVIPPETPSEPEIPPEPSEEPVIVEEKEEEPSITVQLQEPSISGSQISRELDLGISAGFWFGGQVYLEEADVSIDQDMAPLFRVILDSYLMETLSIGIYGNLAFVNFPILDVNVDATMFEFGGAIKPRFSPDPSVAIKPGVQLGYRLYSSDLLTSDIEGLGLNISLEIQVFLEGLELIPYLDMGILAQPLGGNEFSNITFDPIPYLTGGVVF